MQNGLGVTLKSSVIFKMSKSSWKGSIIITEKIHESKLKSFVKIEFEIFSIYKAQCAEENSLLKFTELFQEMRDTNATQGLKVTLQNSSVKCLLRSYHYAAYWKYGRDLEHANDASYAISRIGESRQPWSSVCIGPNRLFSKRMKGKILNFLLEVEKMISVNSVQG